MELYADLKVLYKKHTGINKKSMKKNDLDILIASTAMAENATLISYDGIFEKLSKIEPKFKWENCIRINSTKLNQNINSKTK
jgi:predicted nucleic acid-binding protein